MNPAMYQVVSGSDGATSIGLGVLGTSTDSHVYDIDIPFVLSARGRVLWSPVAGSSSSGELSIDF